MNSNYLILGKIFNKRAYSEPMCWTHLHRNQISLFIRVCYLASAIVEKSEHHFHNYFAPHRRTAQNLTSSLENARTVIGIS
jgi:hypothetical protein